MTTIRDMLNRDEINYYEAARIAAEAGLCMDGGTYDDGELMKDCIITDKDNWKTELKAYCEESVV